jgi:outer membrane lipoprotein-sorting protein
MSRTVMLMLALWVGLVTGLAYGAQSAATAPARQSVADPNALDTVLKSLQHRVAALKSYQVHMDYVFQQPLLESQQRRTGMLCYAKLGDQSFLRIDFETLQQDEEKPQPYRQQYLFDGVWLLEVDHQLQSATRRQLAEPNRPLDAFSLASKHVPVLGFSQVEDLRKQFEISLVPAPPDLPAPAPHLHLKVKPDSVYKDDYVSLDFWIDCQTGLPARVHAVTPEEDVYEIKLTDPKVNTELDHKLFRIEIPRRYSEQAIPLVKRTPDRPRP